MSYKFMSDPQNGYRESDSTDNLTIDVNARQCKNSSTLERFCDSKSFRIVYFLLSTAILIAGIVCLALASQVKCEPKIFIELQNETKIGELQEIKTFSSPVPNLLNVSFASGPGHVFQFHGVVTTNDRWMINFFGRNKGRQTLYHFNPRPEVQTIVRNYKYGSKWGIEERDLCQLGYPFQKGKSFEVQIIVEETKFITYVDGDLFFDYAPALFDPTGIYYIEYEGGVKMNNVTVFDRVVTQTR